MNNREVIEAITEAFNNNNDEAIVSHMTDDIEWHLLGSNVMTGKQTIADFFKNNPQIKVISCTQDHFLVDGDQASVSGEIECQSTTGQVFNMYYCDIYELEDGKVKKMVTYGINI